MTKSPAKQSREYKSQAAMDNQMQPNDFFAGVGINENGSDRSMSLEFHLNGEVPPHYGPQDDDGLEEDSRPMLNIENPDFYMRLRMYLKPKDSNLSFELIMLLADTVLAITYIAAQFAFVLEGNYVDEQDKLVQLLIAFGVTGAILCYCVADAARFLQSWTDRILYFISCLL